MADETGPEKWKRVIVRWIDRDDNDLVVRNAYLVTGETYVEIVESADLFREKPGRRTTIPFEQIRFVECTDAEND